MLKRRGPSRLLCVMSLSINSINIYAGNENWFQSHDLEKIFVNGDTYR